MQYLIAEVASHYCTLNQDGEVVDRGRIRTTSKVIEKWFKDPAFDAPELDEQLDIEIQVAIRKRSERWHVPSTPIPDSTDLPVTPDSNRIFKRASLDADGQAVPRNPHGTSLVVDA
jgi:hypothetical protein